MGTQEETPSGNGPSVELGTPASALQNTAEAFARTLKDGHYNELKVALFFMLRGFHVNIGFRRGRYDLDVIDTERENRFSVEVKWDQRAAQTGNLYFECRNTRQNQPSGLFSSDAEYWCHVLGEGERAFFCSTPKLRSEVERLRTRTVRTGGLDSNSEGHLVPLQSLRDPGFGRWIDLPTVEQFFGEVYRAGQ